MTFFHYNKNFKDRARDMRKAGTLSEAILWNCLKGRKVKGKKFTRQKPIDNYIVDFYCPELKLAIEIDGDIHNHTREEDLFRQKQLELLGIEFLRFSSHDVEKYTREVVDKIKQHIEILP